MRLIYHLYIANWGIMLPIPPTEGNQKQPLNKPRAWSHGAFGEEADP